MNNDTPAFPACNEANVNGTMGMSLRDWFAGQALAMSTPDSPKGLAQWAYAVADAMLAQREQVA